MAYTRNDVAFKQNQEYDEQGHADALQRGLVSFAKGFDLTVLTGEITNGVGNADGVFFQLGLEGETTTLTLPTDGVVYAHAHLDGVTSSYADLGTGTAMPISTTTDRYVQLYTIAGGKIETDHRMSQWIDDVHFEADGDDAFILYINGKPSPSFSGSVIQSSYTKSESDKLFVRAVKLTDYYVDSDYESGANLSTILRDVFWKIDGGNTHPYRVSHSATSTTPNLNDAIKRAVEYFYGVTPTRTVGFDMTIGQDYMATPGKLVINVNGTGTTYELAVDNFGTIEETGTVLLYDLFTLPKQHTGNIQTVDGVTVGGDLKVFGEFRTKHGVYGSVKDRNLVMYEGTGKYMYSGQTINLTMHGYDMQDIETLVLVFSPYQDGEILNGGKTAYTMTNLGLYGNEVDCFYDQHTVWVAGAGQEDAVKKRIDINADGVITGRDTDDNVANRSAVLYRVFGIVSEEAYARLNS